MEQKFFRPDFLLNCLCIFLTIIDYQRGSQGKSHQNGDNLKQAMRKSFPLEGWSYDNFGRTTFLHCWFLSSHRSDVTHVTMYSLSFLNLYMVLFFFCSSWLQSLLHGALFFLFWLVFAYAFLIAICFRIKVWSGSVGEADLMSTAPSLHPQYA